MNFQTLQLIKLGGSVITDKTKPFTAKIETIKRLANEMGNALEKNPNLHFVLGHGSGSFGHTVARKYSPVRLKSDVPRGYIDEQIQDIHSAAERLHHIVLTEFKDIGLSVRSVNLQKALQTPSEIFQGNDIPVVYGDIDTDGTIYSTEMIFRKLIDHCPQAIRKIIFVTDTDGIQSEAGERYEHITSKNIHEVQKHLEKPKGDDVTGGMKHKLEMALEFARKKIPVLIINGNKSGILEKVLLDEKAQGTAIQ